MPRYPQKQLHFVLLIAPPPFSIPLVLRLSYFRTLNSMDSQTLPAICGISTRIRGFTERRFQISRGAIMFALDWLLATTSASVLFSIDAEISRICNAAIGA